MEKHFAVNQVWLFDYKSGLRPAVVLDVTENYIKLCPMSFWSILLRNHKWASVELVERDAHSFLGYRKFWLFWRREIIKPNPQSLTSKLSNITQHGANNQIGAVINNTFDR